MDDILIANSNVIEIECDEYDEGMVVLTPANEELEGLQIAYIHDGKTSIIVNPKEEYKLGLSIVNESDRAINVSLKLKGIKIK